MEFQGVRRSRQGGGGSNRRSAVVPRVRMQSSCDHSCEQSERDQVQGLCPTIVIEECECVHPMEVPFAIIAGRARSSLSYDIGRWLSN